MFRKFLIATAVLVVLIAGFIVIAGGPQKAYTQAQNFGIFAGSILTGGSVSGGPGGQLFSSAKSIDAAAYCTAAGFGTYSPTLQSCTGSYDSTHGVGHGMCESITQAIASNLVLQAANSWQVTAPIDASAFGGSQLFTSNCGVAMLYGGTAATMGATVNGRLQLGIVTVLVDGPTTIPFFTDGAVCASPACTQVGTTSGPSTWGTPAIILPNQFTGVFGAGKDATIFVACATTIAGCGHDWPSRSLPLTSTSVSTNTSTLTTTTTLLAGGQNGATTNSSAPITSFTGSSGTLSFTNTGTNGFASGFVATLFGFTGANTGLNGQNCTISATGLTTTTFQCPVTGSGYSSGAGYISESNIYPTGGGITGEYGFLVGSGTDNNNGTFIIKTVPSQTTMTIGVPTGTTTTGSTAGTLWLGSPMFGWGTQIAGQAYIPQQGGAGLQSFGQRLEDLGIWGSATQIPQGKTFPYGFIAMQNVNGGENAGAQHIQSDYVAGAMLDLHSGATDSGPWNDLRMTNLSNNYAVRSSTCFLFGSAARGIMNSSCILPYPNGTVTTSAGAIAPCAANCVQETAGQNFTPLVAGMQIQINGVFYTISTVNTASILTLTTSPGTQSGVPYKYGQPLGCWYIDGQGPTVNQSPYFLGNHPEACADGYRLAGNYVTRGVFISGFLGGPAGTGQNAGHSNVNLVHAIAAGNTVLGSGIYSIDTQNGGATNTVLDDINTNSCLDLPMNYYIWDTKGNPQYGCVSGTFTVGINTVNGFTHSLAATKTLSADSASITATTAATSTTLFTFGAASGLGFVANTTYFIHCSGTTVQSTGGAGIGIGFQTATNAASVELHATVATGAAAVAVQSSGLVSNTGANVIYAGSAGTITTQLPWTLDGSIAVGATIPSALNLGFYTINAADGVVVKQGSSCTIN